MWYIPGMDKWLNMRLGTETHAALKIVADNQGDRTMASLIREIIKEWLVREGYLPKVDKREKT